MLLSDLRPNPFRRYRSNIFGLIIRFRPILLALITSLFIFLHVASFSNIDFSGNFENDKPASDVSIAPRNLSKCSIFDGILLISSAPRLAAAGTIFFQYVINQIIYANQYNLMPFIHLSASVRHVFDPVVHGVGNGVDLTLQHGMRASTIEQCPGPPENRSSLMKQDLHLAGTGIWNDYFYPVSDFFPTENCSYWSMVELSAEQIKPGLHAHCPWAVRSWRYPDLPPHIALDNVTDKEWYWPMRQKGHEIVQKYFRIRPEILGPLPTKACIGLHVRHSDKKAGRKQTPLSDFYPYLQAFVNAGGLHVYLATDSSIVHRKLIQDWNRTLEISSPTDMIRSKDRTATFKLTSSHHRTNVEVLQDIYALSKCSFLLHGRSAVSEAVMYLNLNLHENSVDLEDSDRYSVSEFQNVVEKTLSK